MSKKQAPDGLKPCPMVHYVSAGLKAYKTGRDPHIICLDCGLSLAAPSWETVYERWNSRSDLATVAQPIGEAPRKTEEEVADAEQIRSTAERLVEAWYYEVSTPRFENDSELAELQFRIAKALTATAQRAQQRGAELQREVDAKIADAEFAKQYHGVDYGEPDDSVAYRIAAAIRAAKQP